MKKQADMNTLIIKKFLFLSFLFLVQLLYSCVEDNKKDIEGIWINEEMGDIVIIIDSILVNNYNPFCNYHLFSKNDNTYLGDTCLSMKGSGFLAGYRIKSINIDTLLILHKDDSLFLTSIDLENCPRLSKIEISLVNPPIDYDIRVIEIDFNRKLFSVNKKARPWKDAFNIIDDLCFQDKFTLNQQWHDYPVLPGVPLFDIIIQLENNEHHEITVRGLNRASVNIQVLILYLMAFPYIE